MNLHPDRIYRWWRWSTFMLRLLGISVIWGSLGGSVVYAQNQIQPDQSPAVVSDAPTSATTTPATSSTTPLHGQPTLTTGVVLSSADLPDTVPGSRPLALLAAGLGVAIGTGLFAGGRPGAAPLIAPVGGSVGAAPISGAASVPPLTLPPHTAVPTATPSIVPDTPSPLASSSDDELLQQLEKLHNPYQRYMLVQESRPDWIADQTDSTSEPESLAHILMDHAATEWRVGQQASYSFNIGEDFSSSDNPPQVRGFIVQDPALGGGQLPLHQSADGQWHEFRWTRPGTHTVVYEVQYAGQPPQYYTLTQKVLTAEEQAIQYVKNEPEPISAEQYVADLDTALETLRQQGGSNTVLIELLETHQAEVLPLLTGTVEPVKAAYVPDHDENGLAHPLQMYLKTLPDGGYQLIEVNMVAGTVDVTEGATPEAAWQNYVDTKALPHRQLVAIPPVSGAGPPPLWTGRAQDKRPWLQRYHEWMWKEREWTWYKNLLEGWRQGNWVGKTGAAIVGFAVDLLFGVRGDGTFSWGSVGIATLLTLASFVGVGLIGKAVVLLRKLRFGRLVDRLRNLKIVSWLVNLPIIQRILNTKLVQQTIRWIRNPLLWRDIRKMRIPATIKRIRRTRLGKWVADTWLGKLVSDPDRLYNLLVAKWGSLIDELVKVWQTGKIFLQRKLTTLRQQSVIDTVLNRLRPWKARLSNVLTRVRSSMNSQTTKYKAFLERIRNHPSVQRMSSSLTRWLDDLSKRPWIGPVVQSIRLTAQALLKFLKDSLQVIKTLGNLIWTMVNSGDPIPMLFGWLGRIIKFPEGSLMAKVLRWILMITGIGFFVLSIDRLVQMVRQWLWNRFGWTPPLLPPPASTPTPSPPTSTPTPSPPTSTPTPSPPTSTAPTVSSAKVNYNGQTVSDPVVRQHLQEIADLFESTVVVTSGDQRGGPSSLDTTNLHAKGRAASFYVERVGLETALHAIQASGLLDSDDVELRYQPPSGTSGAQLHLVHQPPSPATAPSPTALPPQAQPLRAWE